MSDIFLCHAIEDGPTAAKLAAVFQEQDWSVSWYRWTVMPGAPYAEFMVGELEGAKVIVVLWSRAARYWFLLSEVLKRVGQISVVPVLLERIELPVELSPLPAFSLLGWDGSSHNPDCQRLLNHLGAIISTSQSPAAPPISLEELSLSQVQENARRGIQESMVARPEGGARFGGVFISYRRSEAAAYARGLYDRLAKHFGKERVFLDMENVGWGEDFVEAITAAAESCAVMIALISPRWSRGAGGSDEIDDYVRLEVAKALGRKIRVIPILIQGAQMPAPKELPEDLAPLVRRNALALSDTRWERDVEDLMKTLEGLLKD
jgi:hypothetical protein